MPVKRGRLTIVFTLAFALCGRAILPSAEAAPPRTTGAKPSPKGKGKGAQDEIAEKAARTHFENAERAYQGQEFQTALDEYQAAYDALPLPAFLFNIAQSYRQLDNPERAIEYYRRYLMLDPAASNRKTVEDLLVEQERRLDDKDRAVANAAERKSREANAQKPTGKAPAWQAPQTREDALLGRAPGPKNDKQPEAGTIWWMWGLLGGVVAGGVAAALMAGGSSTAVPTAQLGIVDLRR
jgi:tetratricopeptide (TPR) repeat protein